MADDNQSGAIVRWAWENKEWIQGKLAEFYAWVRGKKPTGSPNPTPQEESAHSPILIIGPSGVGKSTLLGMIVRSAAFDDIVVGLIGERSREMREFVEDVLGDSREKAVVVAATGDESAPMRRLAALTAMAVAQSFRDDGRPIEATFVLFRWWIVCRYEDQPARTVQVDAQLASVVPG